MKGTDKHQCKWCKQRKAVSSVRGRNFRWRQDHPLCFQCYRSLQERLKQQLIVAQTQEQVAV